MYFSHVNSRFPLSVSVAILALAGLVTNSGFMDSGTLSQSTTIAFSASKRTHTSTGPDDNIVHYDSTQANAGAGWDGSSSFSAPEAGYYFFSITAVKDTFYNGGTVDDAFIWLRKNRSEDIGMAWSGDKAGKRGTMAFSAVVYLNSGDFVETYADSDFGNTRHFVRIQFSGFKI